MADIAGLLDSVDQTLFPTAVPKGATYDLDTMRMARAALLGNIGATLMAAGQGGQSPESRAAILARLGQGPQAASEIMSQGSQNQIRAMEIQKARQEMADRAARDKFFRDSISGIGGGASGQAVASPTAAPMTSPPGVGAATSPPAGDTGLRSPYNVQPITVKDVAAANPAPPPVTPPQTLQGAVRPTGGKTWWEQLGLNPQMAAQVAALPDAQRQQVITKLITDRATPREVWQQVTGPDGTQYQVNSVTGKREVVKAGDALGPKDIEIQEGKLRGEFTGNEAVKTYNQAQRSFLQVVDLAKRANEGKPGAGVNDTALVYAFFKTIDPTSTVREGEFATVASNMGFMPQIVAAMQKVDGKGFLPPEIRNELVNISGGYLEKQYEDVDRLGQSYRDLASRNKLNAENVVMDPRAPEVRLRYEVKKLTPNQIMGASADQLKNLPIELLSLEQLGALERRRADLRAPSVGPKSVY